MKIFISADIEGLWGVVSRKQLGGENDDYARARKLMTQEVNIVCDALFNHGAKEIVVNDSHGPMDNLLIELLHPDVSLISGYPKDLSMMEGIDESFDCAIMIGYHPKAGTHAGIFDHTYAGGIIASLKINGVEMGECGLNALVAGHFNVPVVLVAGDDKVTRDVKYEIGDVETVAVKQAISRYCAKNLPYNQLKDAYRQAVQKALSNVRNYPVRQFEEPLILTISLWQTVMVDKAVSIPGVNRLDDTTVEYKATDPVDLYRVFRAVVTLADSA